MRRTCLSSVWACALLNCAASLAQDSGVADPDEVDFDLPSSEAAELVDDGGLELEDFDFIGNPSRRLTPRWPEDLVIAPIPGRSPQLGWQLTLGAGYFFKLGKQDSKAPPSILGGFGMVSENGSHAYGAGGNLHMLDGKLRVKAGAAYADVRYRYYGIGNAQNGADIGVDILQEMPMFFATATYRVWRQLYLGAGYLAGKVDSSAQVSSPDPELVIPLGEVSLGAWIIPFEWDSRDHQQFPRRGWKIDGNAKIFRDGVGAEFDAETYKIAANFYHPVGERHVLASRAVVRWTEGDAPFFLLSSFGGSTDLRGYPSGRYRDRIMYALQTEYRHQLSDRWILTGFVGVGEVAPRWSDFGNNFLPAGGIGTRFVLSKKHRVGLSFDMARGKTGTEYYFGVGEAF